ncbi:hypothetical protein AOLI_G00296290 [Acnodon oligacanthus]
MVFFEIESALLSFLQSASALNQAGFVYSNNKRLSNSKSSSIQDKGKDSKLTPAGCLEKCTVEGQGLQINTTWTVTLQFDT